MNPTEKAKDLFDKFYKQIDHQDIYWDIDSVAKQAAILSVKEIIEALEEYDNSTEKYLKEEFGKDYFSAELQNMDSDFRYWSKVKYELETMKVS